MIRTGVALAMFSSSVFAQTIFVDGSALGAQTGASWNDAFSDLQDALAAATPGSQIWVAEGTYRPAPPAGSASASFVLPSGVTLYGGFAGTETSLAQRAGLTATTVLSGDLNGDDLPGFVGAAENSHNVIRVVTGTTSAIVDGFTITGGNANGGGPVERFGGALFSAGSVTVRGATLVDNQAARSGGAVHVEGTGFTLLEDCTLVGNVAGEDGGAAHQVGGALSLLRCTIEGNSSGRDGGAIFISATAYLAKCALRNNHAIVDGGGLFNQHGDGTVTNSTFVGNSAELGGAIYSAGATDGVAALRVLGCTIYGNSSTNAVGGAGIYSTQTGFQVANTILWENVGAGGTDFAAQYAGPAKLADFTCIQEMTLGEATTLGVGNFSAHPGFVDPDGSDDVLGTADDDLQISAGSPCIDAGTDAVTLLATDLAGLPRVTDDPETPDTGSGSPGTVDLGAFEFHSLFATGTAISVSAGGVVGILTHAGPAFAGELYFVLGGVSGTHPGLSAAGHQLLLNPDPYFFVTLNQPNQPPLQQSFGVLDAQGAALTTFVLPPGMDPVLAGVQAHHACAVISASSALPVLTTTPFPLTLVP